MTEQNNSPAPLTAEVAQMVADLTTKAAMINMGEGIAWGSDSGVMDAAADMLTALATQLAERDAELARVTADLCETEALEMQHGEVIERLSARIAALTEALRTIHKRAISTRGDQAYREFPRFAEKVSRAALATTDKEPKT